MTPNEMTNMFDMLYTNIMSNSAPGLSEYEKSVFLTMAQDEIVRAIYNKTFEGNEELRRCIDVLITDVDLTPVTNVNTTLPYGNCIHTVFELPTDIMYIIIESARYANNINSCWADKYIPISPALYDDLQKDIRNPFRGATETQAKRIEMGTSANSNSLIEILSKYDISEYHIRYLRRPQPILLTDISDEGLNIEGRDEMSTYGSEHDQACELNKIIHKDIVERAVELAKVAYNSH